MVEKTIYNISWDIFSQTFGADKIILNCMNHTEQLHFEWLQNEIQKKSTKKKWRCKQAHDITLHLKYHKMPKVSQPKMMYVQNIHNLHPLFCSRIMFHLNSIWTKEWGVHANIVAVWWCSNAYLKEKILQKKKKN